MIARKLLFLLSVYIVTSPFVVSDRLGWLFHIEEDAQSHVCNTNYCQKTADEFMDTMNRSVDPCDNFYQFVCGRFDESHEIPSFSPMWNRMLMFQALTSHRLKRILEVEPDTNDLLPVRKAKKFYRSCMDKDVLEERGLASLESFLMRTGGWPMTMDSEEWDADEYSWQTVEHYYFHITGSYVLYIISPPYYPGAYREDIGIAPGVLPFHEKLLGSVRNYTGDDYKNYMSVIAGVAQIILMHNRANVSDDALFKDVHDLVNFEKQLYLIRDEGADYEPTTFDNFTERYNSSVFEAGYKAYEHKLDFRELLQTILDFANIDTYNITEISIQDYEYFIKLTELLNNTPERTIVNYIHWHFVSQIITYTTEDMRNIFFSLMEKNYGVTARQPRWLECLEQTQLTEAAAYAFMINYFSEETEQNMMTIIDNVREGMKTVLDSSDLMYANERQLLQEKLSNMTFLVGFPSWYKNTTAIVNSFKGLNIGYDFVDNILSYGRYSVKSKFRQLLQNDEEDTSYFSWNLDPITVNAMYGGNRVQVPAADFQPPLFTPEFPQSINYGMTGAIVGHEIGHGFDSGEFLYVGYDGSFEMSNATTQNFNDRVECFKEQWRNVSADYLKYSGLRQILSDATGLKSAFHAYRKLLEKSGKIDSKLPGFEDFTHEQMFFISFGNMWCETYTEELVKKSPEMAATRYIRVLSGASNSEDFAKAFNCPKGSPMNRENKCDVWNKI